MRTTLLALLVLALPAAYGVEVYKWTDAEGKIHYSDLPPRQPVQQEKRITLPKPSLSSPTDTDLRPSETQRLRELGQSEQARRQEQQRQEAERRSTEEKAARAECDKYSKLAQSAGSPAAARQLAREQLAEGDYRTYRRLNSLTGRRQLQNEYSQKAQEYCR